MFDTNNTQCRCPNLFQDWINWANNPTVQCHFSFWKALHKSLNTSQQGYHGFMSENIERDKIKRPLWKYNAAGFLWGTMCNKWKEIKPWPCQEFSKNGKAKAITCHTITVYIKYVWIFNNVTVKPFTWKWYEWPLGL